MAGADRAVIPGATVEISSPALLGGPRSGVTSDSGTFLPPANVDESRNSRLIAIPSVGRDPGAGRWSGDFVPHGVAAPAGG